MANVARLYLEAEGLKGDESSAVETLDQAQDAAAQGRREALRIAEALLFAATEPLDEAEIRKHMADGTDVRSVLEELRDHYAGRGVNLSRVAKRWYFRTAADLGWLLSRDQQEQRKLSKAALETLAIIAYHQPVTRVEIEDIRGVAISRGTIDVLMETGWVRLRGRRKAPGRPVTYGTTESFLLHFGLENITDLPGLDELKSAGLFDGRLPRGFGVPTPSDDPDLREDEDPLEGDLFEDLPLEDEQPGAEGAAQADAGPSATFAEPVARDPEAAHPLTAFIESEGGVDENEDSDESALFDEEIAREQTGVARSSMEEAPGGAAGGADEDGGPGAEPEAGADKDTDADPGHSRD